MRVASWNPNAFDNEFYGYALDLLAEAAEIVAARARALVPVAIGPRGGKLKSSIRVVLPRNKVSINVRVYAGGYHTFYAGYAEFGSSRISPYHYLQRGLDDSIPAISSILKR